jgi:hypothetical protein
MNKIAVITGATGFLGSHSGSRFFGAQLIFLGSCLPAKVSFSVALARECGSTLGAATRNIWPVLEYRWSKSRFGNMLFQAQFFTTLARMWDFTQ